MLFTRVCIEQYAEYKGQAIERCCLFKCNVSPVLLEVEDVQRSSIGSASFSQLAEASRVVVDLDILE